MNHESLYPSVTYSWNQIASVVSVLVFCQLTETFLWGSLPISSPVRPWICLDSWLFLTSQNSRLVGCSSNWSTACLFHRWFTCVQRKQNYGVRLMSGQKRHNFRVKPAGCTASPHIVRSQWRLRRRELDSRFSADRCQRTRAHDRKEERRRRFTALWRHGLHTGDSGTPKRRLYPNLFAAPI